MSAPRDPGAEVRATERELTRLNRELVRALGRLATTRRQLRAAETRVSEIRRELRLFLQGAAFERIGRDQAGDADLERVAADLTRPDGETAGPA